MRIDGRIAVITGAASGIGRAITLQFARHGARVIGVDVNAQKAAEVLHEAESEKLLVEFMAIDLTDVTAIARGAAELVTRCPRLDILVNAAGWDRVQPFVDNSPEFIQQVVALNLGGPLHLTRALLPAMIAANAGKIVNVASDAGRVGSSGETAYAAAKGGVIAFTKSLAREVARYTINVNCVCPGPTDTPLFRAQPEKLQKALTRAILFRRIAKPEEIADAVLFFASSHADYITGQILSVSGGLTLAG